MNHLYFGDNLGVMREHMKDESVDLIYLDPPFNSKRDYNLLFKTPKGHQSEAQIEAFEDSWHWNEQTAAEFEEIKHCKNTDVSEMMQALHRFLGENDMMAYLTMMANRLLELHRILKPMGSLYLHCDPTASHYLKIVLDGVFGKKNFRNELIWKRTSAHSSAKRYGPVHDTILYYAKSDTCPWNQQYAAYDPQYLKSTFNNEDKDGRNWKSTDLTGDGVRHGDSGRIWRETDVTIKGRHWAVPHDAIPGMDLSGFDVIARLDKLDEAGYISWPIKKGGVPRLKQYADEMPGLALQSVWIDIPPIGAQSAERLGYPTQKPLALLKRIISASSNVGDTVLDPFCGCGTVVHASQILNRRWIGIDITHLAISLIEKRLNDAFYDRTKSAAEQPCLFEVHGTPKDYDSARNLAGRDKYQFQWWAVSLVGAQPYQGRKKGADGGIDGLKYFDDYGAQGETKKIVISVKGGNLKPDDIRALNHVRERENAEFGLLITLNEPSDKMRADATTAGYYESMTIKKKYPRLQILTIDGLLSGKERAEHPDAAPGVNFKKAKREKDGKQGSLFK